MVCDKTLDEDRSTGHTLSVYLVKESWIINEEPGEREFVFLSLDSARRKLLELVKETKEDDISDWLHAEDFVEGSGDNRYTAYIEGDYFCNHYEVAIHKIDAELPYSVMHRVSGFDRNAVGIEDLLWMIDKEKMGASPAQIERIRSMIDVYERIEHRLFNRDDYWETYWDCVERVAMEILEEMIE